MKKLFLMVVLLLAVVATGCKGNPSGSASDASSASKAGTTANSDADALIDELIEVTDMKNSVEATLNSFLSQMGLGLKDKELVAKVLDELPQITKEVYSKNFSYDELKELLEMSKDEINQKMMKKLPQIMEESMAEGKNFALGQQSPTANMSVPDDFKAAMKDYFEAQELDKQMEQINQMLGGDASLDGALPDITTRIFSKYFTVDEIKHVTELSKLPIAKKMRDKQLPMAQEINEKIQKIIEDYMKSK